MGEIFRGRRASFDCGLPGVALLVVEGAKAGAVLLDGQAHLGAQVMPHAGQLARLLAEPRQEAQEG